MNVAYTSNLFTDEKPKTNTMLYDKSFKSHVSVPENPENDTRLKPSLATETLMSNLVNYNSISKYNDYLLEGSDGDITFDFGEKESFIEIGLYGNIMDVQNLVNSRSGDGVLWGKIPGVLSYDREYNTTYNYNFDGVEYSTGTGLQGSYFEPLKSFYEQKQDYKFIDSNVEDRLKVQDNYRIDSGSKEGVFTDTTLVDGGKTSINFWTYDNIPLPLVDNLQTYIMVEENKSLNDSYREILSYAYDLLIESKENDQATSILSNMFGISSFFDELWRVWRQGIKLDRVPRRGTSTIILNKTDFKRVSLLNKKPSEVIGALVNKQEEKIKSKHSWIPETNLYKSLLDTLNSETDNTSVLTTETNVMYTSWDNFSAIPDLNLKRSDPFISSILYIGGIGFPINQYNVVSKQNPQFARWQYGANNYVFAEENGPDFKAGYSGNIT
ncbi:hypothetical protein NPX79_02470 [Spiroplasma endosymbiont of Anurida maritima]|uniref:hypothetical protein n=1 Tax=Spiroplasma endosymbiont of Anurida maritima TaxID=2967972 RepID=UPI0036D3D038